MVRPPEREEVGRSNLELDRHRWLGHWPFGETMRYVAIEGDRWVALVGFGSAVYQCPARDQHLRWSAGMRRRRLPPVVNNQRVCVLPGGRWPNLASQVLEQALRRVSADYEVAYGHPVVAMETFTDP